MTVIFNRIAITGPECSGKTTTAEALQRLMGGSIVPEYARHYLSKVSGPYDRDDLDAIALGQMRQWMSAHERPVICDTEMTVMKVWSEERFGEVSELISMLYAKQQFDLYLLCRPDIEWQPDPLRENPTDRPRLFERYRALLDEEGRDYHIIQGNEMQRMEIISAIMRKSPSTDVDSPPKEI